jgi:hypothetical protein
MPMFRYFLCFFIVSLSSYFLRAAHIVIDKAVKGNYEAEKYLASQHLVTNLHLSTQEGKRPLILILG